MCDIEQTTSKQANTGPYRCVLSKKRFQEIKDMVSHILPDQDMANTIVKNIQEITGFNEDAKTYKQSMAEKARKYREDRKNTEGISTYKLFGHDKRYQARKQEKSVPIELCAK